MKVALFTSLFKDYPLEHVAEVAAQLGYDGLELQAPAHVPHDSAPQRVASVKATLAQHGLGCPAIFTRMSTEYARTSEPDGERTLDAIRRFVDIAGDLGVDMLVHSPGGPAPDAAEDGDHERAAHWMGRVADICAPAGIRVAMELHHRQLTETIASTCRILREAARDNLGVAYDIGNLAVGAQPYADDAVAALGDRLFQVHVNDVRFFGEGEEPAPERAAGLQEYRGRRYALALLGEGRVDIAAAIRAIRSTGYDGWASLETRVAGVQPEDVAAHEIRAFRRLLETP